MNNDKQIILSAPSVKMPLPNKAWTRPILNPTTLKMLGLINIGQ